MRDHDLPLYSAFGSILHISRSYMAVLCLASLNFTVCFVWPTYSKLSWAWDASNYLSLKKKK